MAFNALRKDFSAGVGDLEGLSSVVPSGKIKSRTVILPVVRVPVLSRAIVSTRARVSME